MKKILKSFVLLLVLVINTECVAKNRDIVFVDRIIVSYTLETILSDPLMPRDSAEGVTSEDDIMYYVAKIGVINPTKKEYNIKILCVDNNGRVVLKRTEKRSLPSLYNENSSEDVIRSVTQTLSLDPKPGAMVSGQIFPLEDDKDYYIQLYFEKKLLGITTFHYDVEK